MDNAMDKRRTQVLYDKKWEKFVNRAKLFRFIPFVSFVFGTGSMAYGTLRIESDFDVIVSVKKGRIFSARLFCIIAFGIFGWRRKKVTHDGDAKDKICLNHFITYESYRLSEPHNEYWKAAYLNLVPLYGDVLEMDKFYNANKDWMGENLNFVDDLRYQRKHSSPLKSFVEYLFSGIIGDYFEKGIAAIQIGKIKKSLKNFSHKPRVKFNDRELEFHREPDMVNWDGMYWRWK